MDSGEEAGRWWAHLQVDCMAAHLRGSEVLGVVTRLHMVVGYLHVHLMPHLGRYIVLVPNQP